MRHRRSLALALLLPLLGACASTMPPATTPPAAAAAAATATPAPSGNAALAQQPDDNLWVATSAEYAAATWEIYRFAGERIAELSKGRTPGSWAVVLDVDETVLSNVQFEIELANAGREYDEPLWRQWENRGEATAIPGVARFCARVRELGGKVVLVTNREEDQRAATEANLRRESVPYDVLIPRANGGSNDKSSRWRAIQEGTAVPGLGPLEELMFVGDNIKDFPGGDQAWRKQGDDALRPFGDRFIVIPNPMYGSWKPMAPAPPPAGGGKG